MATKVKQQKDLLETKSFKAPKYFIMCVVGVILLAIGYGIGASSVKQVATPAKLKITDTAAFGDSVLNYLFELRVEHPGLVYAQFILETGNFTSERFLRNRNICGMTMPWNRPTLAIGTSRGLAVYNSWKESVVDYLIYQSCYMRNLTQEEYLSGLSPYAEDKEYLTKILKIYKKYQQRVR